MANPPMMQKIANTAFEKFTTHPGEFLLISGMIGWAASCVNQLVAIALNKKIPKKQKYFLFPQEITDGIVNVTLFAIFTRSFTRVGERLVESGHLLPKGLRTKLKDFEGKLGKPDFDIKRDVKVASSKVLDKFNEEDLKDYNMFRAGVSFAFSTLGSVVSCDAVTPFVRNKIASARQKKSLERDQQKALELEKISAPVLPEQNDVGGKTDRKPQQAMSYYAPRITSGGSMRV